MKIMGGKRCIWVDRSPNIQNQSTRRNILDIGILGKDTVHDENPTEIQISRDLFG